MTKTKGKRRYAIYLRETGVDLVRDAKKSVSDELARVIALHREIASTLPGALIQARAYRKKSEGIRPAEKKVQTYLDSIASLYLEEFARIHCDRNCSQAVNKIIEELAVLTVTNPTIFT